jgi:hypothetical protein
VDYCLSISSFYFPFRYQNEKSDLQIFSTCIDYFLFACCHHVFNQGILSQPLINSKIQIIELRPPKNDMTQFWTIFDPLSSIVTFQVYRHYRPPPVKDLDIIYGFYLIYTVKPVYSKYGCWP